MNVHNIVLNGGPVSGKVVGWRGGDTYRVPYIPAPRVPTRVSLDPNDMVAQVKTETLTYNRRGDTRLFDYEPSPEVAETIAQMRERHKGPHRGMHPDMILLDLYTCIGHTVTAETLEDVLPGQAREGYIDTLQSLLHAGLIDTEQDHQRREVHVHLSRRGAEHVASHLENLKRATERLREAEARRQEQQAKARGINPKATSKRFMDLT